MDATATPLRRTEVDRLPKGVLRPAYTAEELTPGIVHIGVGNFHRAHMAWYTHRLMQAGGARDWAILGAGVRPYDAEMRARLLAQDCLTTLIQLDPAAGQVEVTGAMIDYVEVAEGHGPLIAAMTHPRIRIVSLTVTEGGYYRDAAGGFDADHADIAHDVAHPDAPRTAFGAIVAALRARRAAGHGAFTGLSCDNLQGNGRVLRATVLGLAERQDPGLAAWIAEHAAFPDSMVDCIVPATGPHEVAMAEAEGIADAAPVTHERFRQWVIEDHFAAGRPDWDRAGATFVADVVPYEEMKLRLLNAGHQVLANAGELLGLRTIADCMADPEVSGLLDAVLTREVAPHVAAVPGTEPDAYIETISARFANPMIHDTVRRVAFDGSSRHPGFVLPSVRDALAADAPLDGLALTEALWCRMCAGLREDGSEIAANDPHWAVRAQAAAAARDAPAAWLAQGDVYGALGSEARFAEAFAAQLRAIEERGVRGAIRRFLGG
ncbi:mannitol dehydrogenase family protein [Jannaschia formosa]|uniref:mannitol dehydrogenase family protein n=1 Tax=Jannaschia formosa TaxID=2259592 RepID=UPI001FD84F4B|nr:mannitol dehydrogenase family protein [Jannaschia formosa]